MGNKKQIIYFCFLVSYFNTFTLESNGSFGSMNGNDIWKLVSSSFIVDAGSIETKDTISYYK